MSNNVDEKRRHYVQMRNELVADIVNSNLTFEQLEDLRMYVDGTLSSCDPRHSAAVKKLIESLDRRINWLVSQVDYYAAKARLAEAELGCPIEDWLIKKSSMTS